MLRARAPLSVQGGRAAAEAARRAAAEARGPSVSLGAGEVGSASCVAAAAGHLFVGNAAGELVVVSADTLAVVSRYVQRTDVRGEFTRRCGAPAWIHATCTHGLYRRDAASGRWLAGPVSTLRQPVGLREGVISNRWQ